jgi:hypothetical protein
MTSLELVAKDSGIIGTLIIADLNNSQTLCVLRGYKSTQIDATM